jgi:signal transduction histidine kinase
MRDLPPGTIPPPDGDVETDLNTSGLFPVHKQLAAVAVTDPKVANTVAKLLAKAGFSAVGEDALDQAWTVVASADGPEVSRRVERLRARMPAGAALIMIVEERATKEVVEAHRHGAYACLRLPLVAEEFLATIDSINGVRSARLRVEELSRELRLQAHLASLGRVTAGLSHEISNPLAAIRVNAGVLSEAWPEVRAELQALRAAVDVDPNADPDLFWERFLAAREVPRSPTSLGEFELILEEMVGNCTRLARLIDLMAELVVLRSPSIEELDLGAVAAKAVSLCPPQILAGVALETEIDEPVFVHANPVFAEQVALNLLTNAIHAARSLPAPRVRIHVYPSGPEGILSVRDNGPGIPEELRERIFEPFYTTRRGKGGTGLGLALCREYARQMGGSIELWSVVGRGACFRLRLPRQPS